MRCDVEIDGQVTTTFQLERPPERLPEHEDAFERRVPILGDPEHVVVETGRLQFWTCDLLEIEKLTDLEDEARDERALYRVYRVLDMQRERAPR